MSAHLPICPALQVPSRGLSAFHGGAIPGHPPACRHVVCKSRQKGGLGGKGLPCPPVSGTKCQPGSGNQPRQEPALVIVPYLVPRYRDAGHLTPWPWAAAMDDCRLFLFIPTYGLRGLSARYRPSTRRRTRAVGTTSGFRFEVRGSRFDTSRAAAVAAAATDGRSGRRDD